MEYTYDQVLQIFVEKLAGTLTPEDERSLEKNLAENTAFRKIWKSLEKEATNLNAKDFLQDIHEEADLNELKQKINTVPQTHGKIFYFKKIMAAAAILAFIFTGSYFVFFQKETLVDKDKIAAIVKDNKQNINLVLANGRSLTLSKDSSSKTITLDNATLNTGSGTLQYTSEDTTQNTLWVPAGESYKLVLSDGTQVWLNAATSLRFPFRFSKNLREVYVEGEAFFKVAKDAQHPFVVHTSLTDVQVLGTSFNINTYQKENIRTALVEGRVLTKSSNGKSLELKPGFEANYQPALGFTIGAFDEDEVLSWMNGVYYFHNMPVTKLAQIASRCYGINIVPDKAKFSGKSITGMMDKNKLTDFLNDLETVADIKYYYSGNDLYLK